MAPKKQSTESSASATAHKKALIKYYAAEVERAEAALEIAKGKLAIAKIAKFVGQADCW
jgi:hypothetical protein